MTGMPCRHTLTFRSITLTVLLGAIALGGCGKSDKPTSYGGAGSSSQPLAALEVQLPPAPANKPGTAPPPSAQAARATNAWVRSGRSTDKAEFPDGTVKHTTTVNLFGNTPLVHNEYLVPAGVKATRRWDHAVIDLPDGRTLHGNSLAWQAGQRNFAPWSFLFVRVVPDGADKPIEVLKPSLCTAAASAVGNDWASAQITLERPLTKDKSIRVTLRFKRVSGDPYLYALVLVVGGTLHSVSLSGYPNYPHPVLLNSRLQQRAARFVDRERWVWAAGHDWTMHDRKIETSADVNPDDPGGVFFYNRLNSQTGGMMAVFVPSEVHRVEAKGTYGVSTTLTARSSTIRLALAEWVDASGWPDVRERFVAELPVRVDKLGSMDFAWPLTAEPEKELSDMAQTLLRWTGLDAAIRPELQSAWSGYLAALEHLAATPVADTPQRFKAEVDASLARDRLDRLCRPALKTFLASGDLDALAEPVGKDNRP